MFGLNVVACVLLLLVAAVLIYMSVQFHGLQLELRAFRHQISAITGDEHEGRVAGTLDCLHRLLILAETGRLPSLRKDDWIPSILDRDRTKGLRARLLEQDAHLDAYEGGQLWR